MSVLPSNDKERKNLPIFRMITGYFPKALREVTRVCVANNVRYNPERKPADINWARGKSNDQMGSLFRHILEREVDGHVFEELPPEVQAACGPGFERVYVLAEAAWRALAALELEIERQEGCRLCAMPAGERHLTGCHTGRAGVVIGSSADVAVPVGTEVFCESFPLERRRPPVALCACGPCCTAREHAATGV